MKKTNILSIAAVLLLCAFGFTAQAQYVTVGNGTSGEYTLSATNYYHSMSQQIYTAAELGSTPMKIHSVAFHQAPDLSYDELEVQERHMKVFMKLTNKSSFASNNDWVSISNSNLVYEGPFYTTITDEWTTLTLNSAFEYDGSSNLLIAIIDEMDQDEYEWQGGHDFYATTTSDYRCLVYGDDDNAFTTSSFASSTDGWSYNERANVRFFTTPNYASNMTFVEIGTGASTEHTTNYLPTYVLYDNTITEQIYTNAELGGDGSKLYGVQFYQSQGPSQVFRNVKVYVSSTSSTEYLTNSSWTTVINSELVYQGGFVLPEGAGWVTVWFDSPKTISNGYNYALVMTSENDNWTSSHYFATHETTGNTSIYKHSDNDTYNATSMNSIEGSTVNYRNNVRFITETSAPTTISCSINGPDNGVANTPLTFNATGTEGATFSWNLPDASPSSATGNSVTATWSTPGTYTITLTATLGGLTSNSTKTVTITNGGGSEGIEDAELNNVAVYPNPTTGMLTIEANGLQRVDVLDMTGRTLMTTTQNTIDLTGNPAGVYMVRISTANGTAVRRVVMK